MQLFNCHGAAIGKRALTQCSFYWLTLAFFFHFQLSFSSPLSSSAPSVIVSKFPIFFLSISIACFCFSSYQKWKDKGQNDCCLIFFSLAFAFGSVNDLLDFRSCEICCFSLSVFSFFSLYSLLIAVI